MRSFAEPAGLPVRLLSFSLRAYLCLFMVGCAAHRPPLHEIRNMETRLMPGGERTVFKACVGALQDLGYTVDSSDRGSGLLTASRSTHQESGIITEVPRDPDKEGLPTWAIVLLIVTGVILIVALVAVLTSHDDSDKAKDNDGGRDSTRYRNAPEKRETRHHRRHHEEPPPPPTYIVESGAPERPARFEYRLTLNLHGKGRDATEVRASLQGSELHGDQAKRSGPVDDPRFFERFFNALDESLRLEQAGH